MVALGRPGAGEAVLEAAGFTDVERVDMVHVYEWTDPELYARALASSGPAFEAIAAVGEEAFLQAAEDEAREQVREGLPLRAEIKLVAYLARTPARRGAAVVAEAPTAIGFLGAPPPSLEAQRLFDDDRAGDGYVTNVSRLWAHRPTTLDQLADLMGEMTRAASLTLRQRAVLITTAASTVDDSYCSLAWGRRLADEVGADVAAAVIGGDDRGLDAGDRALARWARQVATDPNATGPADVEVLRDAGFDDEQIFAITTFVALRLAFSMVNDALGASPVPELGAATPASGRAAVAFGRPIDGDPA
jgi:alkylhydroperoxidase family enzyme